MIFEPENYRFILEDCIYSLSAGFIVSFINEILKSVFYKTKIMIFIKDILISVIFAIVIFSYVISFANYSILRWYHILFSFTGFLLSRFSFSKILKLIFNLYFSGFSILLRHFKEKVSISVKIKKKTDTKKCENDKILLKSDDVLLYNE